MSATKSRKPEPSAIYARVSDDKSGRDNAVSISEQIGDCQARAAANGDPIVAVYIDDEQYRSEFSGRMVQPSAKRPDRPNWKRMLADAGKGWKKLYAWRADRICRGNETTGMFERILDDTHISVELITQVFDRDTFGLLAGGIGGYELRSISVRMAMGREGRVKNGKYVGRTPRGYRALRDDLGKNIGYELTAEGRVFLDELARLFLERVPMVEIGRLLGPNPRNGLPWPHSTIRWWLQSEFYRGTELHYGRNRPAEQVIQNKFPVQHEAAWDAATAAAIDAELARRDALERRGPRRRIHNHLLVGVLYCGYCGLPMIKSVVSNGGPDYFDYKCNPRRRGSTGCPPNHISETRAVKLLRAEWATYTPANIDALLDQKERAHRPPIASVAAQASIDQDEAEVAELEEALPHAKPAAARLIEARLTELRAGIAAHVQDNTRRRAEAAAYARAELKAMMLELAQLNEIWDELTYEQKRDALKRLPPYYVKHRNFVDKPDMS